MTTLPSTSSHVATLTGLPTAHDWSREQPNGCFCTAGSLIALDIIGLGGVVQKYGREAGDHFVREIVAHLRQIMPRQGVLLCGAGNVLLIWFPSVADSTAREFLAYLRQRICATPITLPGNASVLPRMALASVGADGRSSIDGALQAVTRELVRQPEFSAPPTGVTRAVSVREELDHRLAAMSLFGRDGLIEQVLAALRLPAMLPQTVLIVAPPQAGKTRLLSSIARLFGGQRLPIAEINCRPSDQSLPGTSLASIIYQFLSAYPPDIIEQRLAYLSQANPWLCGLFPVLGAAEEAPAPPNDAAMVRRVLQTMLMDLVRGIPHVAIVHNLQLADAVSLDALADVQAQPGHGLRLIGGVDPIDDALPACVQALASPSASVMRLTPLSQEQVRLYLQEVLPELSIAEMLDALYDASGGLPLLIEYTLRAWAEHGVVDLRDDQWSYHPETAASEATGLGEQERARLTKAAALGTAPMEILTALWKVTPEEARHTVACGRAMGYLRPIDFNEPDLVQFADPDHAQTLLQGLSEEERIAIHAEISALLEVKHRDDRGGYTPELAYHLAQAGFAEQARIYQQQLQLTASALTPILVTPQAAPMGGIDGWDIPPAMPIEPEDINKVIDAALALRLAGVQFRLYPPTSELARAAVRETLTALEALFNHRPSMVITYDGRTIAFDGQIIQRRDLQVAVRDFLVWMGDGNLRAIGITAAVREFELSRFLHALATFEPKDNQTTLLSKVILLNLTNIKVLTRSFQADLPQMNMPMGGGAMPPLFAGQSMSGGHAPSPSHANGPQGETGHANRMIPLVPPVVPTVGGAADTPQASAHDVGIGLDEPESMDDETWAKLPSMLQDASARSRRSVMAKLARWLGECEEQPHEETVENIDTLLVGRLRQEDDRQTLHETIAAIEFRLDRVLAQRDWTQVLVLLEPFRTRLTVDHTAETQRLFSTVLGRIGENIILRGILNQETLQPAEIAEIRRLILTLDDYALRPLINALKSSTAIDERARLMQVLRELGDAQQPLLLGELRGENPWYVYRNLLQVLAEVGTDDALPIIGERMLHADSRVRAEAVAAAAHIAHERAVPYLVQGLEDADPQVRARAAALVSFCPEPRILEILLAMLQPKFGRDEPLSVQLTACLGLGFFPQPEAREALQQILHPRLFSPYRKKSDEIRAAAVTALAQQLPDPPVEAIIRQAMSDRSQQVRQAAQRAWQQQIRTNSGANA